MKNLVNEFRTEFSFEFKEIDIKSDVELFREFKDKIPVLKINGNIFAKFSLDSKKFRKKLENLSL